MNLSYYLKEVPLNKGKFMAATVSNGAMSEKEFLTAMNKNDPDYSLNDIKGVLKLMVRTASEVLANGNSILIPGFLRISPSVKGLFDADDEGFTSSKHKIGINCTVSPAFAESIEKQITVEKIKKPDSWPKIKSITDNISKSNVINRKCSNKIKSSNMAVVGHEFAGLAITCKADLTKKVPVELSHVDIIKHSQNELVFSIYSDFIAPDWLVNDAEILIQLRYKNELGVILENPTFETKWVC